MMKTPSCDNCLCVKLSKLDSTYNKCRRRDHYCTTEMTSSSSDACTWKFKYWEPDPEIFSESEIKEVKHKNRMNNSIFYRIWFYITQLIISLGDKKND